MTIRTLLLKDIPEVVNIEHAAWGIAAATAEQIQQRSRTFSMGSIVVETGSGKLIAYAAAQLVNQISTKSWAEQTDNGMITNTHKQSGQIAYGVSMSALPEGAKYGIGAAIIGRYYEIFIKSGRCSTLCLGSRLPGFKQWHIKTQGDIKSYLNQTHKGFSRDPELRLYQKNGFQLLWEIKEYYPDPASLDYGAMIAFR